MSDLFKPLIPADVDWQQDIPFARQFNDIYFSRENGLEESYHVFISGNHLLSRWKNLQPNATFIIAETGFGTGLNFLLTVKNWQKEKPSNGKLYYYACEKHPLKISDLRKALTFWPELSEYAEQLIAQYPALIPGFHSIEFADGVHLILMFAEAEESLVQMLPACESLVDSWYLDGFSPAKNQSMWTPRLFDLIGTLSHKNTRLSTFSCARKVKEGLLQAGYVFEKAKGYGQKREMIKAKMVDPGKQKQHLKKQCTWQFGHRHPVKQRQAIVLGAGLAGSMIAYQLANMGWEVTIMDISSQPGMGASANAKAIVFPSVSAYQSPLSLLTLQAYSYAIRFYKDFNLSQVEHEFNGIISINGEEHKQALKDWINQLSPMVELLSPPELTIKAGLTVTKSGFWFPQSGWINSHQLCCQLVKHGNVKFVGNVHIDCIESQQEGYWHIGGHTAEVLILANGWQMKHYPQTDFFPLRAIKGQMTAIKESPSSRHLRIPICSNGHALPSANGNHYIGATYQIDCEEPGVNHINDRINQEILNQLPLVCDWSNEVVSSWSGIRTTTNDYLPIVGAVPDQAKFIDNFRGLSKDANRVIENHDPFLPNLYAFTGFGSKGLTTIPLCAKYLANQISNQPPILSKDLISALAPSRFLRRLIIKREIDL